MTPLSYLSVLKISGADAGKFLQAQLTANLTGLNAQEATFAAYCSSRGQVIATLLLSPREDHWLAVVEASLLPVLVKKLRPYILRDDVQLDPLAGHWLYGVGPQEFPDDSLELLETGAVPIRYAMATSGPVESPQSTAAWQRSELLFGIPWLNTASTEKYIPQMLGLDTIGAVSFSKGCYPGQEVIARARHLGEVKRRPQVLDLTGPGAPDLNTPCRICTSDRQVEATLVHCVTVADSVHTVFAVAALQPGDGIRALEQSGQQWEARRALREQG